MKRVICDHAGETKGCADAGGGNPCAHSKGHFETRMCQPWPCYWLGADTLVKCVEIDDSEVSP